MTLVNNRCKYAVWLLVIATLSVLYLYELNIISRTSLFVQIANYVGDETAFWASATQFQQIWQTGHLENILTFSTNLGYGYIFWCLSALILGLSKGSFSTQIFILHSIFLLFKYLAYIFSFATVVRLRGYFIGTVFLVALLLTSGFYFYGKIFAPHYLALFCIVFAIWLLARDEGKLGWNFYSSVFIAVIGVFIKLSIMPAMGIYIIYALFYLGNLNIKKIIISAASVVIAVIISCIPLFTTAGRQVFFHWTQVNSNIYTPKLSNLHLWLFNNLTTWDQIPMGGWLVDFKTGFIFFGAFIFGLIFRKWFQVFPSEQRHANILATAILLTSLIFGFIISLGSGFLYWYIFPAYFLALLGLILSFSDNRNACVLLIIALIVSAIVSGNRIIWRINNRVENSQIVQQTYNNSKKLTKIIEDKCNSPVSVLTDILIAYQPSSTAKNINVIRLRDFLSQNSKGTTAFFDQNPNINFIIYNRHLVDEENFAVQNNQVYSFTPKSPLRHFLLGHQEGIPLDVLKLDNETIHFKLFAIFPNMYVYERNPSVCTNNALNQAQIIDKKKER